MSGPNRGGSFSPRSSRGSRNRGRGDRGRGGRGHTNRDEKHDERTQEKENRKGRGDRDHKPYGMQERRNSPNRDHRQDRRYSPNRDHRQDRRYSPNRDHRQDRRYSPNRDHRQDRRYSPNREHRQDRRYSPNGDHRQDRRYSPNRDQRQDRHNSPHRDYRQDRRYSPNSHSQERRYSSHRDYRQDRRNSPHRDRRQDRRNSPDRDHRQDRRNSPNRDHRQDRRNSPNRDHRQDRRNSPHRDHRQDRRNSPGRDHRQDRRNSPNRDHREYRPDHYHKQDDRREYRRDIPDRCEKMHDKKYDSRGQDDDKPDRTIVNVYVKPAQQHDQSLPYYPLPQPPIYSMHTPPLLPLNPPPLMNVIMPQPPPYTTTPHFPMYGSNLTSVNSSSNHSLASNSSRHSYKPQRQVNSSSYEAASRGGGRGRGRGRGRGHRREGQDRGTDAKRRHSSITSNKGKDDVESIIGSDIATENQGMATKNEKKKAFLFFIFKNMSDESFDYEAHLKSRTESLQSVEYSIEDYMKTDNSKVVLALFPSKASAYKVIKLFKKTNSSSDHEILCYMQEFLPPAYYDLSKLDLENKEKESILKEGAAKEQISNRKPKKKKKQKKQLVKVSGPVTHETTLYIRINDAVKSDDTDGFIKARMGRGSMYPFQLISSTLGDNGSSTNVEIKVPSEAIANLVIQQLEDSNTDSSTNVVCSLIPVSCASNSNKEIILQVLSDITIKAKQRIEHHDIKITETSARLEDIVINSNVSVEEYNRKVAERDAIKAKLEELKSQKMEYQKSMEMINTDISQAENMEKCQEYIQQLSKQFSIECCRLDTALPIYARRSDILSCVTNNQVIILRGATGSGKSTQIAQYLYESDLLKEKMIVCTQPRKVACVSLATRVSEELLVKLGKTVGYKTGMKQKTAKNTKVLFMTDHTLLNECIKDLLFTKYSVIIIDEAHERSIYTDLLLGIVKKCLPHRPDLKVIISSATIDIQVFTDYFQSSKHIEVAGRTFPVEVVWKSEQEQPSDDYEDEAVKMVIQVHEEEGPGDILVFMTTPLETEKCKERLETNLGKDNNSFKCLTLHGQLNIQEQQLVFEPLPENQRKIVFATNTAETSITIPGIKYVIDTGLAKEMNFDPKRNINCLTVNVISQSSAEQRKGRAGRTAPGKCYRLYTEQTFLDMKTSNVPEILRVHLGQALLKLLQFGIDLSECDFVESPSQDALDSALKTLVLLNAVEDGKITEHGNWLARVPFEPRLSTIVKNGFDKGFIYDALVVASLMSSGGLLFYRGGSEDEKNKADLVKTQFCQHQGDCFTLLKVYKEWIGQPEGKRNKWCFENYVNSKVIRGVHETITEILGILKRELEIEVKKEFSTDDHLEEDIQKLILSAFSENIAHFTGHRKVGYFVPSLDQQVFIHPSSALKVLNDTSDWVVFCNVLRTSTDFITTVTPVKEEWIRGMMKLNFNIEDVKSKQISKVHTEYFGSNAFSIFVGPRFTKLRKYEEILTQICGCIVMIDADRDLGEVRFYASTFNEAAQEAIAEWRDEAIQVVLMKTEEFQLGSKRTRTGGVRIVLGKGGESTLLLMPFEYRSVHITKPNCQTSSKEHIKEKFSRFGEIVDCWEDKKSAGKWGRVTFSSDKEARLAVEKTETDDMDVAIPEIRQAEKREFQLKCRLTWSRRPSKNMAFVDVNPLHLADILRLGWFSVRGQAVKIDLNDKSTGLILRRLPPNTREDDIKEGIYSALNFVSNEEKNNIQRVSVVRQKAEATSVDELDNIKREISDYISNCLSGQTGFVVDVMKPKKDTDINFVAYVKFYSAEDGYRACNGLNGAMHIKNQPVTMTPDISSSINISQQVYDTMKPSIDEAVEAMHRTLDFKFHEKELNSGRVILNLYSKNSSDLAQARALLDGMLKGEVIECWRNTNYRHLFLQRGRQFIRKVEEKNQTVIRMDERMNSISIFGTMATFTTVQRELEKYLSDILNANDKEIDLRASERPRGLMKALIKQYGLNLERLVEDAGVQSILLNHKRQTVKIFGESEALDAACRLIDELSESLLFETFHYAKASVSDACDDGDRLPECCTCLCPIDNLTELYRLEHCSHPYCLDCFKRQIQVAIQSKDLPVLCSEETCQKPFTWVDFRKSFMKVQIEPRALVGAAVTNFMLKSGRGIFHHCLTPDCPVIYKTNTENTQYICEECGIRICSSCHIEYHDGLSCAMYKSQEKDREQIEEYLRSHANSVKPCPNCRVPIEKNRGCNHMVCPACKVDFCWHCTAKFSNAGECYDHLQEKHGGIAGIDDILYN